jgi:hypothetical protein
LEDDRVYLVHIFEYIERIERYTEGGLCATAYGISSDVLHLVYPTSKVRSVPVLVSNLF